MCAFSQLSSHWQLPSCLASQRLAALSPRLGILRLHIARSPNKSQLSPAERLKNGSNFRSNLDPATRAQSFRAFESFRDVRDDDEVLQAIVGAIDAGASADDGVDALLRFREAALPYLVQYLDNESSRIRLNGAWGLSRVRREIPNADGRARLSILELDRKVVDKLIDMAHNDESAAVRAEATTTLDHIARYCDIRWSEEAGQYEPILPAGEFSDLKKELVDAIAKATEDPHRGVADQAFEMLWKQELAAVPHLPKLIDRLTALKDGYGSNPFRGTAEARSARNLESLANKLRSNAHSGGYAERRAALQALSKMGPAAKEALPVLESMLQYRSATVLRARRPVEDEVFEAVKAIKGDTDANDGN